MEFINLSYSMVFLPCEHRENLRRVEGAKEGTAEGVDKNAVGVTWGDKNDLTSHDAAE